MDLYGSARECAVCVHCTPENITILVHLFQLATTSVCLLVVLSVIFNIRDITGTGNMQYAIWFDRFDIYSILLRRRTLELGRNCSSPIPYTESCASASRKFLRRNSSVVYRLILYYSTCASWCRRLEAELGVSFRRLGGDIEIQKGYRYSD